MLCMQKESSRAGAVFMVCTETRGKLLDVHGNGSTHGSSSTGRGNFGSDKKFNGKCPYCQKKGIELRIAIRRRRMKPVKLRQ
jgi:hypothetical protein